MDLATTVAVTFSAVVITTGDSMPGRTRCTTTCAPGALTDCVVKTNLCLPRFSMLLCMTCVVRT